MSITKRLVRNHVLIWVLLVTALRPAAMNAASESDRLERLERAVEQLQKRNAELEAEVQQLKGQARLPLCPDGQIQNQNHLRTGKRTSRKSVTRVEKLPLYVQQRGPELKLVLGGFVQVNFEDGDVSAFEGRFGQTAIDDRFRLRRARINLTGDFAEQFDFKMEGDFGQSDGTSGNRTAFSATDIWVNYHQFPAAQVKIGQYKAPFGLEQLTPDTHTAHDRTHPANRRNHARSANRCRTLGKTVHEHLA